jgi:hypothetical protein
MVIWTWIVVRGGENEVAVIPVAPLELVVVDLLVEVDPLVEVDLKHATGL